VSQEILQY